MPHWQQFWQIGQIPACPCKYHIIIMFCFFSNILLLSILDNNVVIILLKTYTSRSTLCALFKCLRFKCRFPALGILVLCSVYGTHIFIWPWLTEPVLINIQGWVDLRLEQEEAPAVVNEATLALWRGSRLKFLMAIVVDSCLMGVAVLLTTGGIH